MRLRKSYPLDIADEIDAGQDTISMDQALKPDEMILAPMPCEDRHKRWLLVQTIAPTDDPSDNDWRLQALVMAKAPVRSTTAD
ncbi:hypothetical protein DFP92_11949 [Yoonia sediminilitoris]|uniref:Uncharacterized protein n=1 Tax=Yoonia sediminilitoris TaxID=1286148 RepID=A0A2T6K735_9RHOB|nr:hypothetical protein C8N45_11949 [Yoonia sediminilitoris]RCW89888.1 hypothetical protein DFP92_11949 [Yoonia sediminilitoris]